MEHTCELCAQLFTGRKRKYCSDKCMQTAQTLKQNAKRKGNSDYRNTIDRVCTECGCNFKGRSRTTKFCSRTCSAFQAGRLTKKQRKPRPQVLHLVQCDWCHALHTKSSAKYCSATCRTQACEVLARANRSPLRRAIEDQDYPNVLAHLKQRSTVTASGCWEWQGRSNDGYPVLRYGRTDMFVHRIALEAKHQAPLGSQAAHHTCANTRCVNPEHLQPVTHRENVAEMLARKSYLDRIEELEVALSLLSPNHPLLHRIAVA